MFGVLLGPAADRLARLRGFLHRVRGAIISVEGHTDNLGVASGEFSSNWELSSTRAIAVVKFLIGRGLDGGSMRAIGYADTMPIGDNATAEELAQAEDSSAGAIRSKVARARRAFRDIFAKWSNRDDDHAGVRHEQ